MSQLQCPECGYRYDEQLGEPHQGYPAGTAWDELPEDFTCPDCAVRVKADFVAVAD
ncbi:MAG TPA: rubredoxin [Pseudomonas sp.]|nr:rubredoxin [Pseudomonas sp.]